MSQKYNLQNGNALVTLIFAIIIATIIYFLIVPEAKRKLKKDEQDQLPSTLASQLSQSSNRPLPAHPTATYDGVLSWTKRDDVTINPFEKHTSKDNTPSKPINDGKLTQHTTDKNAVTLSPLGNPLPKKSNYLDGYDIKYARGSLTTTIDNIKGDSDLIIFLKYHGRVNDAFTSEFNLARVFFVKKGEKFEVISLDSGAYSMEWLRLKDGAKAPTQPFLLYKDVKFQYNRIIRF